MQERQQFDENRQKSHINEWFSESKVLKRIDTMRRTGVNRVNEDSQTASGAFIIR
jgi:hypothetical protein